MQPGDVVSFRATSDHLQPAYCLAKSVQHRQILLVVRGTKNFYDALTNLAGESGSCPSMLHDLPSSGLAQPMECLERILQQQCMTS